MLQGSYVVEVGGDRFDLGPGDSVLAPRGTPHVWAHVGEGVGLMLVEFHPAGLMEGFFGQATQLEGVASGPEIESRTVTGDPGVDEELVLVIRTAEEKRAFQRERLSALEGVLEGTMDEAFPVGEAEVTQLLVVSDVERSKTFYVDVLGAELYREYGGDSVVLRFLGLWILLVAGGPPTQDKPDVTFAPPEDSSRVDHQLTIRVPDCRKAYSILQSRGAEFLTPPVDRGGEVRCFFRDPDDHLLEISEVAQSA